MSIDTLAYAVARRSVTDAVARREELQLARQMGVAVAVAQRLVNDAVLEHRGRPYNGPVSFAHRPLWVY